MTCWFYERYLKNNHRISSFLSSVDYPRNIFNLALFFYSTNYERIDNTFFYQVFRSTTEFSKELSLIIYSQKTDVILKDLVNGAIFHFLGANVGKYDLYFQMRSM